MPNLERPLPPRAACQARLRVTEMSERDSGWHPSPFEDLGVGLRRGPSQEVVETPLPAAPTSPEPVPIEGPGPLREEHRLRAFLRALAAPFVALFALALKFKTALLVVFKFKLFTVAGSMLVSLAAYPAIWGWAFALGFVVLLLVHELGHVLGWRDGDPAFYAWIASTNAEVGRRLGR